MYNITKKDKIMYQLSLSRRTSQASTAAEEKGPDTIGKLKLYKTIGELYIVYLQSQQFLLEKGNRVKMTQVKNRHDELENIFQDLTQLQEYENEPEKLLNLNFAYYGASSRNLIFKYVADEKERKNLQHYEFLKHVDSETKKITNGKSGEANYNQLFTEFMQDHINRIRAHYSETKNNSDHEDDDITMSNEDEDEDEDDIMTSNDNEPDWLKSLSSSFYNYYYVNNDSNPRDTNWYFIDYSLGKVGINPDDPITKKLSQNLNTKKFKNTYIAIGKALFDKDNDKVKSKVDNYLKNYTALCQKFQADYNEGLNNNEPDIVADDIHEDFF